MLLLTVRDLQHRAGRVLQAVLASGLLFTLALLVAGIADGFGSAATTTVEALNRDTWLVPAGQSGPFTGAAAVPRAVADDVVADGPVTPAIAVRGTAAVDGATRQVVILGIAASGPDAPGVPAGAAPPRPGEVVVSSALEGAVVGGTVAIAGEGLTVTQVVDGLTLFAGTPIVLTDLGQAQDLLLDGQDVVTTVLVAGDPGDVPAALTAVSAADVAADSLLLVEDARRTISMVRVLLWLVAGMIIGTFVHLAALERTGDFAVLRAVGATPRKLAASLALQSAVIALLSAGIALVLQAPLAPVFPLFVDVTGASLVALPFVALAIALLASTATLRRVVRVDPADAFGGL